MNKITLTLTVVTALAGMAGAAGAQSASTMLPAADSTYLTQNAQGSVADFATGETAVEKASANAVQQYAINVVEDHARLNLQLLMLAQKKSMTLPVTISSDDKTKLMQLSQKSGSDFDHAFLQEEVTVNAQDVADARRELSATTDPDVRNFVTDFLNTEQVHLDRARQLLRSTGTMSGKR